MGLNYLTLLTLKKQKAFALTEVLLSIAVIIIIGIVAYPLYESSKFNGAVESTMAQVAELQSNFSKSGLDKHPEIQATGTLSMYMRDMGLAPDGLDVSSNAYFNPVFVNLDGECLLPVQHGVAIQCISSAKMCVALSSRMAAMFSFLKVGNHLVKSPTSPLDMAYVTAQCSGTFGTFPMYGNGVAGYNVN